MAEFDVRRATGADWRDLRAVRIAALTDSPGAFGSTLARELAYDEARWRTWTDGFAVFLGRVDGEVRAVAAGAPAGAGPAELISVWADPGFRGSGLSRAVVGAVVDWAAGSPLHAWVVATNDRALGFYRALGFTETGVRQQHDRDPLLEELDLVRN